MSEILKTFIIADINKSAISQHLLQYLRHFVLYKDQSFMKEDIVDIISAQEVAYKQISLELQEELDTLVEKLREVQAEYIRVHK